MFSKKQRLAIENILILAQYARDNSVASEEDEKIILKSISLVEEMLGIKKQKQKKTEIAETLKKEINSRLNP